MKLLINCLFFLSFVWYIIILKLFIRGIPEFNRFDNCSKRLIFSFELIFIEYVAFFCENKSFIFSKILFIFYYSLFTTIILSFFLNYFKKSYNKAIILCIYF